MKEQIVADEKSDGLDIVSVGELYAGPWEKKYWSSSRGKDRHPYPVGYVALRVNNGNTYKMAILEGLKGPEFVISSTDGQSCSGQTPDIAWEGFQKKSCVRIKFWRGKRFSCKIDGAELFGLKNPHVMRLLRGLKANVSQIPQKSSPSLAFGNGQSEATDEHHTKYPDLHVNLVKVQSNEKKNNKRKEIQVKSVSGPGPKRERPQDLTQRGHEPHCRPSFEGNHNSEILSSSSNLKENNISHSLSAEEEIQVDSLISSDHLEKEKRLSVQEAITEATDEHHTKYPDLHVKVKLQSKEKKSNKRKEIQAKSVSGPGPKRERPQDLTQSGHEPHCRPSFEGNHNNGILSSSSNLNENNISHLLSAEEGIHVDSLISSDHLEKEKCLSVQEAITEEGAKLLKSQENHDLSMLNRTPGSTFSKTVDEKGDPPLQKESQMLDDVNLYAPDTLDLTLDTCNLEVEIPKESTCTLNEKLNSTQSLVSEKCVTDSHSKDEMSIASGSDHSEKSDSDPVGQEISNSMMALLLPRALPLLKTFSRKKKKNLDGMFQKERKEVDQYLKDEPPAESSEHLEKLSGEVHIPDKPSTENVIFEKQNESVLFPSTSKDSAVPGLEDSTTVAPDSFENDQCEIMDCSQARQVQDTVKADLNTSSIDLCTYEGIHEEVEVSIGNVSSMLTVDHVAQKGIIGFTGSVDAAVPPHQEVDGLSSVLPGQRTSQHDKNKMVHNVEEAKVVPNDELESIFELVGCYILPTPVSVAMLRTKGDEVFVCVLCGYSMENGRTLFLYKASIKGETRGCPSFVGHTTIISPTSSNTSARPIVLDSSSLQFTPDGKSLVLLNSIKAPYCREGSVKCGCSECKSDCFEKNAVKIVQVKLGYVQVVCKLKTMDNVCSILVCGPNYLVASEESGKMNLWTMNSSWSAPTDQSYLSTSDCMPNCIVEMKRIPKFPALVVGHSAFGDFCLWDLTRRTLVSKFSAPRTSFLPFIPINLFRYPSQTLSTSDACRKKQIEDIMDKTQRWSLGTDKHETLPVNEEHLSLVILVSSVSNLDFFDEYSHKDLGVGSAGSWSLALLAKKKLVSENALDPSATVVGASSGYGIIGTCDGSLYIWELSTGTKLGYLSHCTGATVSCLAVDDSDSGAFAVAVDGSQLRVYAPETLANKKT